MIHLDPHSQVQPLNIRQPSAIRCLAASDGVIRLKARLLTMVAQPIVAMAPIALVAVQVVGSAEAPGFIACTESVPPGEKIS
ncbi:hypothetical protein ELH26_27690 (plasmid) [Rhizobium leguminosarum]|nr:hypothetical protein ELH26_27690 [Rhizobium leguminosarum]